MGLICIPIWCVKTVRSIPKGHEARKVVPSNVDTTENSKNVSFFHSPIFGTFGPWTINSMSFQLSEKVWYDS